MKLTRSFPAKASAREKVPDRIVTFKISTPVRCSSHSTRLLPSHTASSDMTVCDATALSIASGMMPEPLRPLNTVKYTMPASVTPHHSAPTRRKVRL